jgi:LemA protein
MMAFGFGMILILGGLVIVVVVGLALVGMYNQLVGLRNAVKNAFSQMDVQLKRRHDLIPNLVETVKGYMEHERETLEAVVEARQQAVSLTEGTAEQLKAEGELTKTLRSLFAVAENYPDLKANQNFLALQEEITSTENKISFARQHYNDSVMRLNNQIEMFPSNLVASTFRFTPAVFYELESEAERQVPKVAF